VGVSCVCPASISPDSSLTTDPPRLLPTATRMPISKGRGYCWDPPDPPLIRRGPFMPLVAQEGDSQLQSQPY
jgi:hypothetical protein